MELSLPHLDAIKFAKNILSQDKKTVRIHAIFPSIPTLAMLVESAAQGSSALMDTNRIKNAYLVGMKNIQFYTNPNKQELELELTTGHALGNMIIIDFKVFEKDIFLADGSLTLATQED